VHHRRHFSGRPASNDVAVGHHTNPIGDLGGEFEVVRRQDDADTFPVDLLDPVGDQSGPLGVEPCEGFV
jgi:hypothetical protein